MKPAQPDAFAALRDALPHPPILALPRREGHYTLDADASDGQLGCCLHQDQPTGDRLPVGFWSRWLTPAERNYSTTDKECLAVVWSVLLLRPYLEDVQFTVRTDHHALRWVLELGNSPAHGRLERWRLRLLEFDFNVQYRPGAQHHAADAMSRLETEGPDEDLLDDDFSTLLATCLDAESGYGLRRGERIAADGKLAPISREKLVREQATDSYCNHWLLLLFGDLPGPRTTSQDV